MFHCINQQSVSCWRGTPDCQAAHNYILDWLTRLEVQFLVQGEDIGLRRKGNLGECIAFLIARDNGHGEAMSFAPNGLKPTHNISRPEIDIVWLFLEDAPAEDYAVLQEVKTTGASNPDYADQLIVDTTSGSVQTFA